MNITLAWAVEHFEEANGFANGGVSTIAVDSGIRQKSQDIFGGSFSHQMMFVCNEIFRVIAEDAYSTKHWRAKKVTV